MHLRLEWATRMHLLWAHWNPVKLRAVCFWAPGAVAAFTQVQCCSRRKVPDISLLCKPSTTCPDTATLWFGSPLTHCASPCALSTESNFWYPFWSELWAPLPRALLNLDVSHFLLFTAAQPDPGERPVSSCCVQLSDLQETVLLLSILFSRELRRKAQSQVLQDHTAQWSALPNAKGQSIPFPAFYPVSLTINVIALINIHSKRSFAQTN